jgi:hypothetical protein
VAGEKDMGARGAGRTKSGDAGWGAVAGVEQWYYVAIPLFHNGTLQFRGDCQAVGATCPWRLNHWEKQGLT